MPKVNGAILKFIPTNTAAGMIQQRLGYTEPVEEFYEMFTAIQARAVMAVNGTMLNVRFIVDPSGGADTEDYAPAFNLPFALLTELGFVGSSLPTRNDCLNVVISSFTNVYLEFHEIDTDEVLEKIDDAKSDSQFYKEANIPGNVLGDNTLLESYDITSIYRSFFTDFMYAYTNREAPNPGGGGQQLN